MREPGHDLSFDNSRLFYLALSLAVVPLWLTHYLPGVDLPGHAAQAAALQELWRENPLFADLFRLNLFTPYMTGTVLLALLSFLVPVSIAVKLVMTGVVVATPLLAGRLLDATGGDSGWRWLLIPSTYSFAFYWGFYPFVIAVPFGLLLLLLTVRLDRRPSVGLSVVIAAFSVFLFFSHLLVLCLSSLLALAWIVGRNYQRPKKLMMLALPYTAPLPLVGKWLFDALNSASYMSEDRIVFGSIPKRLLDIPVQVSGLDGSFFLVSVLVFLVIVGLPFATRMRLSRRPEKWMMAACGFATFMLFPTFGLGTAFLYDRFGLFLPILWFVLWERTEKNETRWHWLGMAAVFIWIGVNTLRFSTFTLETRGFDQVVAEMDPGKRVLSFIATQRSSQFTAPVFLHLVSWYQADRRGIVDYNFGMFYGTVVLYRPERRPPIGTSLAWNPRSFDWNEHGGGSYDYFVIRSRTDVSAEIFKDQRPSVELVLNADWWWLYKPVDKTQ